MLDRYKRVRERTDHTKIPQKFYYSTMCGSYEELFGNCFKKQFFAFYLIVL